MSIFRSADPTTWDDVDGIIINETAPAPNVAGVAANIGILVGQTQRGPSELTEVGSIGEFMEIFGKDDTKGVNKALKNKKFGRLRIARVVPTGGVVASRTFASGAIQPAVKASLVLTYATNPVQPNEIRFVDNTIGGGGPVFKFHDTPPADTPDVEYFVQTGADLAESFDNLMAKFASLSAQATIAKFQFTRVDSSHIRVDVALAGAAGNTDYFLRLNPGPDPLNFTGGLDALTGALIATFSAKQGAGAYGNLINVEVAAGSLAGRKYTIKDNNPGAVLPIEVYDNVVTTGLASTLAGSKLVNVQVLSTTAEIAVGAQNLAAGADGVAVDADYEAALENCKSDGAGNFIFLDEYNAVRNDLLAVHAADTQDKMVLICGAESDVTADLLSDVGNYRDVDGRIIYCDNYVGTMIGGVEVFQNPAIWLASILTQTSPHVDPAATVNAQFMSGATRLKRSMSRAQYIQLKDAGICSFEFDQEIGFKVKSGVVTQIADSSKVTILRRRMADFLTNSVGRFLKNYQNAVNSKENRTLVKGAILGFVQSLQGDGILPKDSDITGGKVTLVDTESANTASSIAAGFFKIIWKQRIYSSMRYIVLSAEIGESVIVTEQS